MLNMQSHSSYFELVLGGLDCVSASVIVDTKCLILGWRLSHKGKDKHKVFELTVGVLSSEGARDVLRTTPEYELRSTRIRGIQDPSWLQVLHVISELNRKDVKDLCS